MILTAFQTADSDNARSIETGSSVSARLLDPR
jgi:hypothetical protein